MVPLNEGPRTPLFTQKKTHPFKHVYLNLPLVTLPRVIISRRAEGPGQEILQCPPSVRRI